MNIQKYISLYHYKNPKLQENSKDILVKNVIS